MTDDILGTQPVVAEADPGMDSGADIDAGPPALISAPPEAPQAARDSTIAPLAEGQTGPAPDAEIDESGPGPDAGVAAAAAGPMPDEDMDAGPAPDGPPGR